MLTQNKARKAQNLTTMRMRDSPDLSGVELVEMFRFAFLEGERVEGRISAALPRLSLQSRAD
jgi:hypothetical protein